jgi:hypothetical protein
MLSIFGTAISFAWKNPVALTFAFQLVERMKLDDVAANIHALQQAPLAHLLHSISGTKAMNYSKIWIK